MCVYGAIAKTSGVGERWWNWNFHSSCNWFRVLCALLYYLNILYIFFPSRKAISGTIATGNDERPTGFTKTVSAAAHTYTHHPCIHNNMRLYLLYLYGIISKVGYNAIYLPVWLYVLTHTHTLITCCDNTTVAVCYVNGTYTRGNVMFERFTISLKFRADAACRKQIAEHEFIAARVH